LNRLHEGEELWITEGASDCWAALSAGHKAIAIPSATLLKPKDVQLLETLNLKLETQFHMAPDRDEPGERLFLQLQKVLPNLEHHQLPKDCKDYADYYLQTKSLNFLPERP
jgi:DNA primase